MTTLSIPPAPEWPSDEEAAAMTRGWKKFWLSGVPVGGEEEYGHRRAFARAYAQGWTECARPEGERRDVSPYAQFSGPWEAWADGWDDYANGAAVRPTRDLAAPVTQEEADTFVRLFAGSDFIRYVSPFTRPDAPLPPTWMQVTVLMRHPDEECAGEETEAYFTIYPAPREADRVGTEEFEMYPDDLPGIAGEWC